MSSILMHLHAGTQYETFNSALGILKAALKKLVLSQITKGYLRVHCIHFVKFILKFFILLALKQTFY